MYVNTEQAILQRLAEHRGGVGVRGLALPLRMNSAHVAIIGQSLARRGLASWRGPGLAITAAGRHALARSRGEKPHTRRGRPRTRAEVARNAPQASARRRARRTKPLNRVAVVPPRSAQPATPAPTRRSLERSRTILDDLRSFWKVFTKPITVGGRK